MIEPEMRCYFFFPSNQVRDIPQQFWCVESSISLEYEVISVNYSQSDSSKKITQATARQVPPTLSFVNKLLARPMKFQPPKGRQESQLLLQSSFITAFKYFVSSRALIPLQNKNLTLRRSWAACLFEYRNERLKTEGSEYLWFIEAHLLHYLNSNSSLVTYLNTVISNTFKPNF